ncbi:MAG: hypothetical protein COA42_20725 [Alteromonadaceae bacterium]|nr:MAG: hypothetical protein COA42_20725 [Alteromonadaceae bacterium]
MYQYSKKIINKNSLLRRLSDQSSIILTANQRLKRFLLEQLFTAKHINEESEVSSDAITKVIHPSNIQTLEQWLDIQWWELQDSGTPGSDKAMLSNNAQLHLWRTLLEQGQSGALLNPAPLAKSLHEAYEICKHYQIADKQLRDVDSEECRFYLDHAKRFEHQVQQRGSISRAESLRLIAQAFQEQQLEPCQTISLYGFNDLSPLMDDVFSAASDQCIELFWQHTDNAPQADPTSEGLVSEGFTQDEISIPSAAIYLHKESSVVSEIQQAAHWAKQTLEAAPKARIGVIVPKLSNLKAQVDTIFTKTFAPQQLCLAQDNHSGLPFDLSVGTPLAHTPMVHDALQLLTLKEKHLPKQDLIALCMSAFWGQGVNNTLRTAMIAWVKSQTLFKVSVSAFHRHYQKLEQASQAQQASDQTTESTIEQDNSVSAQLSAFRETLRGFGKKRRYTDWGQALLHAFQNIGWPRSGSLDSREYQNAQRFYLLLQELADYDALPPHKPVTYQRYMVELRYLCQNTMFNVQTPKRPIQVMGLIEGAGLEFDYCWMMGATNDALPAQPQPNPFIPVRLQREHATPRSGPEHEHHYMARLLQNYQHAAGELHFSYATQDGAQNLALSPLLKNLFKTQLKIVNPLIEHTNSTPDETENYPINDQVKSHFDAYVHDNINSPERLSIANGKAPPLPKNSKVPGGTGHLKLHAINPFYAFLVYRLDARQPVTGGYGLNTADRGSLIHEALSQLWVTLKDSDTLKRYHQQGDLPALIEKTLDELTPRFCRYHALNIQNYERKRAIELISIALDNDMDRPDFLVQDNELAIELKLAHQRFALRLDRVDLQSDGKVIVIDYKTGSPSLTQMQQQPLLEPQLPCYALALSPHADALAYARIHREEVSYKGIGELNNWAEICEPQKLTRYLLPNTWEECLRWWQQSLHTSAQEISDGECRNYISAKTQATFYEYLNPILRNEERKP